MLGDSSSADKLFEDGAQHICCRLLLLGKEIAVYSHDSNVFPLSLIAQTINN